VPTIYVEIGKNLYVIADGWTSDGKPINPQPQLYKQDALGQYVRVRKLKV
jgi:hypothetical protein